MEFSTSAIGDFRLDKHLTRHGYCFSTSSALIPSAGAPPRPFKKIMIFVVFVEVTWVMIDLAGRAAVLMSSVRLALTSS